MPQRGYTNTTVLSGKAWLGGVRETTTTLSATPATSYVLVNSGGYTFYNDVRIYRVYDVGTQEPLIWAVNGEEIIIKSINIGTGEIVFGTPSLATVLLDEDVDVIYVIDTNLNAITQDQIAELSAIDEWVADPSWNDDGTTLTPRNPRTVTATITTDTTNFDGVLSVADDSVQKALDTIDDSAVTRAEWYQNGFLDVDGGVPDNDILITFDNASRTLSLAPTGTDFTYYRMGQKFIESSTLTKQILDEDGLWVFYIGSAGLSITKNPSHDQVAEVIEKTAIVAYVMWDATNNLGKLMWEAHGMNMSPATHHWLHDNIGAVYREGMALSGFTDIGGDGDQDTDVQFNISEGKFYDEDIEHNVSAIAIGDSYDLWYLEGSTWRWVNTTMPGREHPGGLLAWNDTGTQAEADNGDYVLAHIFATNIMTNAGSITREYIFIQGQNEYDSSKLARAGADVEINNLVYGTLPLEEIVPVATIILQTGTGMSNGISASIEYTDSGDEFVDWRGSDLKATGGSIADHGSLAGLSDDDHPQYALADGTRLLVSTDTTLTGAGTVSDPLSAEPYVTSTAITYALIFG